MCLSFAQNRDVENLKAEIEEKRKEIAAGQKVIEEKEAKRGEAEARIEVLLEKERQLQAEV